MQKREKIGWLPLLLAVYLLIIVAFIFATHFSAIQASHPAYAFTLIVVALAAIITLWRALFHRKSERATITLNSNKVKE